MNSKTSNNNICFYGKIMSGKNVFLKLFIIISLVITSNITVSNGANHPHQQWDHEGKLMT